MLLLELDDDAAAEDDEEMTVASADAGSGSPIRGRESAMSLDGN